MSEEYNKLLAQIRQSYQEMSDPNHPINVASRIEALEDARKSRGQCPCFKSCLHHQPISKKNIAPPKALPPPREISSYGSEQIKIVLLTITACITLYGIISLFISR